MKIEFSYRKHKLPLLALGVFLFTNRAASQTSILITYSSGNQQSYTVAASGKLYFDNDNLLLQTSDVTTPTSIATSLIRKLTFSSAAPLPLRLLDFTVRNEKSQVTLAWRTANEVNASHFVIERSAGGGYESLGQVAALNSTTGGAYGFIDHAPKDGITYYRLKQVEADGQYAYSKVLSVNRSASANLVLLPNPASDYFIISSAASEKLNVKIYSVSGQLMASGTYAPGEQIAIGRLMPGMYVAFVNEKSYKFIKE